MHTSSLMNDGLVQPHCCSETSRKKKIIAQLSSEAEKLPGGLEKYHALVEQDHERYSRELKVFKERVMSFDIGNGLCQSDMEVE